MLSCQKSRHSPARCWSIGSQGFRSMATSPPSRPDSIYQLTFWSEEPHASRSASRDCAEGWLTSAATWPLRFCDWLIAFAPAGSSGRMSQEFCRATEDGILVPSSGAWSNAGMGSPTECWTLSISECPSVVVVSSLSDILETGDLPQRFFLSARACAGILRRAEKRGKSLPPSLAEALRAAASGQTLTATGD
jgi:hypothetical protein